MTKPLRVRLCHCCGKINMNEDEILKCESCGKAFLPFFYFLKRAHKDITEEEIRGDGDEGPIKGLTAYW